jgi:hypothetical protein
MNDIYKGFKKTLLIELIETRLEKLSEEQIDKLYEEVRDAEDGVITLPKPAE